MRKLFSTEGIDLRRGYRVWREITREHFGPTLQTRLGEGPFEGELETAEVGELRLTRSAFGALRVETTPATIRRCGRPDDLAVTIRLSGEGRVSQHGRATVQRPGDLMVLDGDAPFVLEFPASASSLLVRVPRERLEGTLGSARGYAALTIRADLPGTSLTRTFFEQLVRVHDGLSPASMDGMSEIGIDLLAASIAERLGRNPPPRLRDRVLVGRATDYVERNLGHPELDPTRLAAAMGVSLPDLQFLFREDGREVSDWILMRRLEMAWRMLVDPDHAHLSIASLACACGFPDRRRFAELFRARHGTSPTGRRRAGLVEALRGPSGR